jgi:hypothetical protein
MLKRTDMSDAKYDKIKHLVEVDDDILVVFTVTLASQNHMENLSIDKNAILQMSLLIIFSVNCKGTLEVPERTPIIEWVG